MNPTALITGASRGIGRGIALALASLGHDLLLNYARNDDAAAHARDLCLESAQKAGHHIQVGLCRADIGLEDHRRKLVHDAHALFPRLNIFVNNAGVAPATRLDLLECSEASFDRVFEVNVRGAFFLTQAVARWMLQSATNVPASAFSDHLTDPPLPYRPKIVVISSISAYTVSLNRGEYCMAKAALSMLTKLFAARLAPSGIGVYELRPGIISTDMTAPVKEKYDALIGGGLTPLARWGTPEDVAKAVTAIALDLLPYSTGEVINIDGGFHLQRL